MSNKMLSLNNKTLESNVHVELPSGAFPEKVLQIGEGNFLRGFVDWMIFEMNKAGVFKGRVVAIQPTPHGKIVPKLNHQDCLYTFIQRGIHQGEKIDKIEIIDSISRGINPYQDWDMVLKVAESPEIEFVFSNTTEAGLQYSEETYDEAASPLSYPGKLVSLLYHRFKHFKGRKEKGWIILPCELVENNGEVLKELCKKVAQNWELPEAFWLWVESECAFCNTLVDRIVTGYPHGDEEKMIERMGYTDMLMTVGEPYHLFVIDGPASIQEKLPFKKAGLNVYFDDISSYRELKVKLLNAPHTLLSSVGVLYGVETVREGIQDHVLSLFIHSTLTDEIYQTLQPKEQKRAHQYINDVIDRFSNPFIHHRLLDISLNGFAKFQTRVMPSLLSYKKKIGIYSRRLVTGLAALICFYKVVEVDGNQYFGKGPDEKYEIRDSHDVLVTFQKYWSNYDGTVETTSQLVKELILESLVEKEIGTSMDELANVVSELVITIQNKGIKSVIESLNNRQN